MLEKLTELAVLVTNVRDTSWRAGRADGAGRYYGNENTDQERAIERVNAWIEEVKSKFGGEGLEKINPPTPGE